MSIGSTKSSKLGFFGTTPIIKQTLSTSSNNMSYTSATSSNYLYVLNNLVGILKNKYGLYIMGKTSTAIARQLIEERIPTPSGKQNWQSSTIESILTNEKYKGDALLQKSFTVDFLSKTKKINEGEVPQYYVENSHPAIIPPEEWKMVQMEIARRKSFGRKYSCSNIFSTRLVCGDCGEFFGAKVWHSTDKYRKVIWQCNHKFKDNKCGTPSLAEDDIKERFVDAINTLIADKEAVLDACRLMQSTLTDCSEIDAELDGLLQEIEVVTEMTKHCIEENAQNAQDQNAYMERYNGLVSRYDHLREQVNRLQEMKAAREREADSIGAFMFELKEYDEPISEFDEKLWVYCVDRVVVHADGKLVFHFRNGAKIDA
ncbi:MAG: recombinase family protein [Clostridia bacterium]|nr:recombinase family protein [Clostridia bacterium]